MRKDPGNPIRVIRLVTLTATICLATQSVATAQDASYPYAPMNPYLPIAPPPANPPGQQGNSLPWPWNPLGTPTAPLPNQTIPASQVPTPTINPPSNLVTPNPIARDGAINPFGESVAPGYTPEPPSTQQPAPAATTAIIGAPAQGAQAAPEEKKAPEAKADNKEATDKKPLLQDRNKPAKKAKKAGDPATEGEILDDAAPVSTAVKAPEPSQASYDPIKDALFQMNSKQYSHSLATLNRVLSSNPNNPRARYVRAIVNVMLRQYPDAVRDYKEVIRLTPDSDLGRKAAEGLRKISL